MRLINPGPGELLDRWTILNLKLEACKGRPHDYQTFLSEKVAIEALLADTWKTTDISGLNDLVASLQVVNRSLWVAEVDVRVTPELESLKLAQLAKRIPKLNDKRAEIISQINRLNGAETLEKLHDVQIAMRTDLAE